MRQRADQDVLAGIAVFILLASCGTQPAGRQVMDSVGVPVQSAEKVAVSHRTVCYFNQVSFGSIWNDGRRRSLILRAFSFKPRQIPSDVREPLLGIHTLRSTVGQPG